MDFQVDKDTQEILDKARALLEEHIIPVEKEWGAGDFSGVESTLEAVRKKVKAAGLWAPQLPKDVGGAGLPLLAHGMLSEVLGRSPLGHYCFGCQAPDAGNAEILHMFGTEAQKERWLKPLASGQIRSCFSMTEPEHAGSNPTVMSTTAKREGNEYVINGHKWFTSAADGSAFAIVMAVTDPDAAKHQRASMIIVPTDTKGFNLVRNIPIMGSPGDGYGSHSEIRYEDCRVPVDNLLGDQGAGFKIAQERLGPGRIHHCMRWLGICERSFDLMCERAASRELRDGETLADQQIVRAWVAESRAEIDAARLLVLRTAWQIERNGFSASRDAVSLIKFHVADVLMKVVDRAIQVHGALGITSDTVLGYFYSHERGARIYDGPDEVHKMVVARRLMRASAR